MSGWVIEVDRVKEAPSRFELEADEAWWTEASATLKEAGVTMHRAFRLDLQGYRLGRRLLFRGELQGSVDLACSRCLEGFEQAFDEPFQLLLEPARDRADVPESGILLDPDDMELGRWAGEELDFGAAVLEILALAWPMQPRCRDSCRGLCPVCGTNLNAQQCGCETAAGTRPFSGLRDLIDRARKRDG